MIPPELMPVIVEWGRNFPFVVVLVLVGGGFMWVFVRMQRVHDEAMERMQERHARTTESFARAIDDLAEALTSIKETLAHVTVYIKNCANNAR